MLEGLRNIVSSLQSVGLDATGTAPVVDEGVADVREFITLDDISTALEYGLLQPPYLQLVLKSVKMSDDELTAMSTTSEGKTFSHFDGTKVSQALSSGYTMKLNQVQHWHRKTAQQITLFEQQLPAVVRPFVFLTPAAEQGLRPHRDASHVLVVQLEGRKEWSMWPPKSETRSSHGLDVDLDSPVQHAVLGPGDVMYLPHGFPHAARAIGGPSLHITFTLALPTPKTIVDDLLLQTNGEVPSSRSPSSRAELIRDTAEGLRLASATADEGAWFERALASQRAAS